MKKGKGRVKLIDNFYLVEDNCGFFIEEHYKAINRKGEEVEKIEQYFYGTVYQALQGFLKYSIKVGGFEDIKKSVKETMKIIKNAEKEIKDNFRIQVDHYL